MTLRALRARALRARALRAKALRAGTLALVVAPLLTVGVSASPVSASPVSASPMSASPVSASPVSAATVPSTSGQHRYDDPSPSPSPGAELPLRLSVTTLAPRAPRPGGLLQVTGRITNVGTQKVREVRLRLRVGDRIIDRASLHAADAQRPPTVRRDGTGTDPVVRDLPPGASTTFDLRTTVADLALGQLGVYPLDIEAVGLLPEGFVRVGLAPTWLPWFNGDPVRPSPVAVVLPLVDTPRRTPDDVQLDDTLAATLSPTGRLGQVLAVAQAAATGQCDPPALATPPTTPVATLTPQQAARAAAKAAAARAVERCAAAPVTLAIDPDLLDTVSSMTRPYPVRAQGTRTDPGTGTAAATAWMAALRTATAGTPPVTLPFADPDVDALTRGAPGLSDLAQAVSLGRGVVRDVLGTPPLATVALPPAGPVTPAAVDVLTADGTRALVLSPSAFPGADRLADRTPGARTPLPPSVSGSPVDALVVDDGLSQLLAGGDIPTRGPQLTTRLVEQRFLVETAIVAAERPGAEPRTFLLSPARRGSLDVAVTTAALRDLGRVPWLCPAQLADVAAGTEHCAGERPVAHADERPQLRTEASGQLSAAYLAGIARNRDSGSQLVDAVLVPDAATSVIRSRLRRGVARAESSAWQGDPAGARRAAATLDGFVSDLLDNVSVRGGGRLLLTSTKGTLTVVLQNTLRTAVQCRVRFSSPTAKLSTAQTGLITVGPGKAVQASVRAAARTSGQFVVLAQMIDRDGRPFGPPARVVVRSTRYGALALGVTGLAAAILLLAAGVRITRRALRHPGGPDSQPAGGTTEGEPGPLA